MLLDALTGTLTVCYHHPTPLNKNLHLVAGADRVEGRKKFMVGELWADGVCTASCEAVLIAAKSPPDASAAIQAPSGTV
jgi:hypothetical protein